MKERFKKWLKNIYHHLVEINDTPQSKSLGFGLGVFLGIFPGVGPIASLMGAYIFKVNRAAALLGSLLTNTWFTIVTFALAVNIGAKISHTDNQAMQFIWKDLTRHFEWSKLNDPQIVNMLLAILAGFFIISFCAGFASYAVVYVILVRQQRIKGEKG